MRQDVGICFFHSFSGHTSALMVHCFPVLLRVHPFLVHFRKYISVYIYISLKTRSVPKVIHSLLLPLLHGLSISVCKGVGCSLLTQVD